MMIRALRIRFNSSMYKSAKSWCVRQRVRRQHSEFEWLMTILSWRNSAFVQNISLKRIGGQQQKKKTRREKAQKQIPSGCSFFSHPQWSLFWFLFFFCVKTSFCCFALFCGSFVKNNLVRKLVSLVFSRSVQRDTRREEEEEEEGRRGRRFFLWWWFPSRSFRATSGSLCI